MSKRTSYTIKKEILLVLKEAPTTYADLERKVNTGYRTVKQNCEELEAFGQVNIKKEKHPSNGRLANIVSLKQHQRDNKP